MKSKAIMLNKYGLNVGAAYVEQSTLLEPNNFIPSWEAGDEEKKEVEEVKVKEQPFILKEVTNSFREYPFLSSASIHRWFWEISLALRGRW